VPAQGTWECVHCLSNTLLPLLSSLSLSLLTLFSPSLFLSPSLLPSLLLPSTFSLLFPLFLTSCNRNLIILQQHQKKSNKTNTLQVSMCEFSYHEGTWTGEFLLEVVNIINPEIRKLDLETYQIPLVSSDEICVTLCKVLLPSTIFL
jgi:hypothetical protein